MISMPSRWPTLTTTSINGLPRPSRLAGGALFADQRAVDLEDVERQPAQVGQRRLGRRRSRRARCVRRAPAAPRAGSTTVGGSAAIRASAISTTSRSGGMRCAVERRRDPRDEVRRGELDRRDVDRHPQPAVDRQPASRRQAVRSTQQPDLVDDRQRPRRPAGSRWAARCRASGCRQRSSASTPTGWPSSRPTIGWKTRSSSPRWAAPGSSRSRSIRRTQLLLDVRVVPLDAVAAELAGPAAGQVGAAQHVVDVVAAGQLGEADAGVQVDDRARQVVRLDQRAEQPGAERVREHRPLDGDHRELVAGQAGRHVVAAHRRRGAGGRPRPAPRRRSPGRGRR